jgi:Glyoxalase-like domain
MVVDHVVMLVPGAAGAARDLRERHGLGSERGPYHDFAGTRDHTIPLEPPQYLEFLTIENREVAARAEAGASGARLRGTRLRAARLGGPRR